MPLKQKYLTLVVDEDEAYCERLRMAFAEKCPDSKLEFLPSSQALLERLSDTTSILPDLIILDLMLPELEGLTTLREVRQNQRSKTIPTLMFSVSDSPSTISICYQIGVNAYVMKPSRFEDLKYVVNSICRYWLETSKLFLKI